MLLSKKLALRHVESAGIVAVEVNSLDNSDSFMLRSPLGSRASVEPEVVIPYAR